MVDKTLEVYGRVDAVVNSSGYPPTGDIFDDILDITDEEWNAGLDLVVLNVVRMARLVTPIMVRQGEGAMVNISTFLAFEPSAAFPVSSSLRSALAGFTKLMRIREGCSTVAVYVVVNTGPG
jgi:NAD(P)-dependent dehydrogenase (short-subunit alcohol dehydrogenase family)